MRRIFLRLLLTAIPFSLILLVLITIRTVRRVADQSSQWLQTAKTVNHFRFDPDDAPLNRSGVPDYMTRTIVMGKKRRENTEWVERELPDWQRAIYTVDDVSAALHTTRNKGREANAYLTYVIQHYDALPDFVVFLHPHRAGYPQAWHADNDAYSNIDSVRSLRLDFVRRNGYANLRCLADPGCPDGVRPFRSPPDPDRTHEHVFARAWSELFGGEVPVPEVLGVACCSQFAVSGEQVRKRERAEYERFHSWLMDTELDDDLSGRVMEHVWHVVFGKPAVYCPELYQCYCDVFGSCYGLGV